MLATTVSLALGTAVPSGHVVLRDTYAPPVFFVNGHGWGHGLGLGQYGAQGYALHGWKYDRIVLHYFPGTTLGPASVSKVRVLVADGRKQVTVSSQQDFVVRDASGARYTLAAGDYTFGPGFKLQVDPTAPPQALPGPLVFSPGAWPLALDQRAYRGTLRVAAQGQKLQVVNIVGLERYLWGVVPSEMPRTWSAEALKAQAVAARSYALAQIRGGGAFDLYDDTRNQVYGGLAAEAPTATAAVNDTAGKVVLYQGHVADTMFFSSSGGKTASVQDVSPTATPVPYLVSVPDPYDSISPYHNWGPFRYAARMLVRKFRVPGRLLDVQTVAGPSGRVRSLVAKGSGGDATVSGADVRKALDLRSTWFSVGVLSLTAPDAPVVYGSRARLTGLARGVGPVVLQKLAYGRSAGAWQDVGRLSPSGGTVAPVVGPKISTAYRMLAGQVPSGLVRVAVAPRLNLQVAASGPGFRGRIHPFSLAGTQVSVQRLTATGWALVASSQVRADGVFTVTATVAPGAYRARLAPGGGFVPGFSPILKVGP
ncbi:MAG: SpoIID/LytB domain-containing protein [Gaiellaceae bacterium]